MNDEKEISAAIIGFVQENQMTIEEEIINIYRLHVLENRYVLHPRKLEEIAKDDIKQLIGFLNSENEEIAFDHGRSRAKIVLSHNALLKMGTYMRSFCFQYTGNQRAEEASILLNAIDKFLTISTSGYIENLETLLLEDQGKIKRALAKAQQSSQSKTSQSST